MAVSSERRPFSSCFICREEYSSFGTIDSGKGFDLVFLRNVCYDSESARILLFGNTLDKSLLTQIMDSRRFSLFSPLEIPRSDFLAVVDGKYPTAAEVGEVSSVGSYLFFTDDAMDRVSQFSSLNFIVHFMHHATRYPSVSLLLSLHCRCFTHSSPFSRFPAILTPTSTFPFCSPSSLLKRPSMSSTKTTCPKA